jgi:hypothetical protein
MEQNMKETGRMIFKMAMVLKAGQMAASMKENTRKGWNMARENIFGTIYQCTMACGLRTKSMEEVLMSGLMVVDMKEIGKTIICMGEGSIHGKMEGDMKVSIKMIENMAMAHIHGLMEDNMLENGLMGSNMVRVNIDKQMARRKEESGRTERERTGLND